MGTTEQEYAGLLTATANRLRLVQADFADEGEQARRDQLAQEVNRALASVAAADRQAFVEALARRFSTWDGSADAPLGLAAQSPPPSPAPPPPPPASGSNLHRPEFDEEELNDPGFLLSRLLKLAPAMSEAARRAVAERLAAAGLGAAGPAAPSAGGWSDALAAPVRARLQFTPQQALDADRVVEALDLLMDFVVNLDQLAWGTWRQVAGDPRAKRPNPLLRVLRAFMLGDRNVPRAALAQEVGALRQLTAALVGAVGRVGPAFAAGHTEKLSPAQIEDAVKAEGKPMFSNVKAACWDKFVALSDSLDAGSVEKEINAVIADCVGQLTKGLGRG